MIKNLIKKYLSKINQRSFINYLNLVLELIPIILFFIGSTYNIYLATLLLIVGSIVSVILYYLINKKLPILTLMLALLGVVFGVLTLALHSESIIKIKVTVLDLIIALTFFGASYWKKNLTKSFMPKITHKPKVFILINNAWGVFFLLVAILNEIVWRNSSTQTWVYFKVFGIISLVVIFALLQILSILVYKLLSKNKV